MMTSENLIQMMSQQSLYSEILWIVFGFALLTVAMIVDLITGVRKAIENGEATTSQGLKKTCDKARKYFLPAVSLICVDLLASCIFDKPYFTMIYLAFCILCETKSIMEKSYEKKEMKKMANTMRVIIDNKDDLAKLVKEITREVLEEEQQTNNTQS